MKGLIAKKLQMSQSIQPNGKAEAITILQVTPNVITQKKEAAKDGYLALQLAWPKSPKKRDKLPQYALKKEFRFDESDMKVGDTVSADIFEVGETVNVTGISQGKGFAGTIKRHNFSRGPMGHGHDHHRQPGSIGAMGMPRVHIGKRMAGHMGNAQVTIKNLKIAAVDTKNNLLAVSGAIPGANQSFVIVKLKKS